MNVTWTNQLIKYVLFIFNFLFVISGIILIAVGVSVKTYYQEYDIFLDDKYFSLPNLLIAIGSIIFFISFFGCCGAIRESWVMVFAFALLLIIIFILELSAGIAGYVLRDRTSAYLKEELTSKIKGYKPNDNSSSITLMWDTIQEEFQCCGAKGPDDWKAAKLDPDHELALPASCCKANPGAVYNISCAISGSTTATPYKKGCVDGFGDFLKAHAVTLGGCGIAIAFIQLFAIIFACHLSRQLKNGFQST